MARKPTGYWKEWGNIVAELQPIMDQNHGLLPNGKNDIHQNSSLALAITKYHGGMRSVRMRLGIEDKKYCKSCGRVLSLDAFRVKTKNGKGKKPEYYRDSTCKQCEYGGVKLYRETDMGQAANLVRLVKARAKREGLPFELTREWVLNRLNQIDWRCELTGIEFNRTATNFFESHTSLSCDQIIPGKGYTQDNVQFVTAWANKAKGVLSVDEFINFCKLVVDHNHDGG